MRRAARAAVLAVAAAGAAAGAAAAAGAPADTPGDAALRDLGDAYRGYLGEALTVARSTAYVRRAALARGFRAASVAETKRYAPGDRLVFANDERSVYVVVIGSRPVAEGVRLVGTHQDTPSLILEPFPLRAPKDGAGVARLLAHAYGGVKSYHYDRRPLAIVGDVRRAADGARVEVSLGLGADGFAFSGTKLDTDPRWDDAPPPRKELYEILAASAPMTGSGVKSPLALTVLRALYDRYGLAEDDLGAAKLYVVPAEGPRDVGLDRLLVGAWGQDDRLNSYAAMRAAIGIEGVPPFTAIAVLSDREEIGSSGSSGMRSEFFELLAARLLEGTGGPDGDAALRTAFARSRALSADTPAAVDPIFPEVHEPRNAARLGMGPALYKFTGRGGKSGGSDADVTMVARVKRIFAAAGIPLQTTELGRVDEGGGGTIARYLAMRGFEIVDVGAAVVSMHSPLELSHKRDLWWAIKGYRAFLVSAE